MTKTYTFGNQKIVSKVWDKPLESPREERMRVHAVNGLAYKPALDTPRTSELLAMLRTMRPAHSTAEADFVAQWVAPLGTDPDSYGNHWLTIGDSPIMWSCHTDTVHRLGGTQFVGYHDGCAYVTRSTCLGADDTVGVWIMRHMILAGVAGTYVFHRAEEIGGRGSGWILDNTPERLGGIDFAIAFDRKGYHDIVTDQMGTTASNEFADSLASALLPLRYAPQYGVFTDTQVYSGVIRECSNVSVGYHNQHCDDEWLDVEFATALLDRVLSADFSRLVAHRDPAAEMDDWSYYRQWQDDGSGRRCDRTYDPYESADLASMDLETICREYPAYVADFLEQCGYSPKDLAEFIGL